MPTGYTAPVEDGEITELKDFAADCARAFGAFIHQRDDSMDAVLRYPDPPENSYYQKSYTEACNELAEWQAMTEEEKYGAWSAYYKKALADHAASRARIQQNNARHYAMLAKVHAVDVPSKLQNFKDFMVQQLETSITNDFDRWYTLQEYVEWCESHAEFLARRAKNSLEYLNDENERYQSRCEYIDLLAKTYGIEVEK